MAHPAPCTPLPTPNTTASNFGNQPRPKLHRGRSLESPPSRGATCSRNALQAKHCYHVALVNFNCRQTGLPRPSRLCPEPLLTSGHGTSCLHSVSSSPPWYSSLQGFAPSSVFPGNRRACSQAPGRTSPLGLARASAAASATEEVRLVSEEGVQLPGTAGFEFSDEGDEIQIRVTVAASFLPLVASQLRVETNEDSVSITHLGGSSSSSSRNSSGVGFGVSKARSSSSSSSSSLNDGDSSSLLFAAHPLFGLVSPQDTVWYIDEDDVILSLRKLKLQSESSAATWPALVRQLAALASSASRLLKGCPVSIVGRSAAANSAIAQCIAPLLGYVPLSTSDLIQGAAGMSVEEVVATEGSSALQQAEVAVLQSLSTHVRIVTATLAGGEGTEAAAEAAAGEGGAAAVGSREGWQYLYGSMVVHVRFEDDDISNCDFALPDAVVRIGLPAKEFSTDLTEAAAEAVVKALCSAVEAEEMLPGKKSFYVRMGSRGDWPELMPPGWKPGDEDKDGSISS